MKTIEEINQIISVYKDLISLVERKIPILEEVDRQEYGTRRGIEMISFDEGEVDVRCDDSYGDYPRDYWFSFPIEWLTLLDADLEKAAIEERDSRLEKERIAKEEYYKKIKEELEEEARKEREKYEELKAKFEKR